MTILNLEALLQPVSADRPCGEDCEYDPTFQAMEQAAEGQPERRMGNSVEPAVEPDWKTVKAQALDLLGRTKDLRVGVYLSRALLHTDGWPGWADGLTWLAEALHTYWESIYPQIDPDDNDSTFRVNSFIPLVHQDLAIAELRNVPLVSSRAVGRFSLRDIDIASGKITVSVGAKNELPQMNAVNAAFSDVDIEQLQTTAEALNRSLAAVVRINDQLTEQLGASEAPDLSALIDELRDASGTINARLSERGVTVVDSPSEDPAGEPQPVAAVDGAPAVPISGSVNSRQDVAQMLDKICEYYGRHEPSSPVPLLLIRAKKLVFKDFLDILKDVAPDAVAQVEALRGPVEEGADNAGGG